MGLFSLFSRNKKEEPNASYNTSNQNPYASGSSQAPYAVASLADGRVRYSDGSIRGVAKTNNTSPAPTTKPTNTQPTPTTQPQNTSPAYNYLSSAGSRAQQRVNDTQSYADKSIDLAKQAADSRAATLDKIGAGYGASYDNYANTLRKGVDIQKGTAQRQIDTAQTNYDDQRYYNETARKERMKGLEGTLASLGTLQSSALNNVGAKINMGAERADRRDQQTLNNRIADVQDTVRLAENEAEGLIQREGEVYRQQMAQLAGSMDQNSIEYKKAVAAITQDANDKIAGILDNLDGFVYQTQLAEMKNSQGQLSDEFLRTGQPVTREDMIWAMENPDKLNDFQTTASNNSGEMSPEKQNMLDVINQLVQADTKPITGFSRIGGWLPGTSAQRTKNLFDRLQGMLTLDNVDKLKGTGSVSDREFAVLSAAASELGRNLNDQDFKSILISLQRELDPTGSYTSRQTGVNPQNIQELADRF